jgi:hypothetical protein
MIRYGNGEAVVLFSRSHYTLDAIFEAAERHRRRIHCRIEGLMASHPVGEGTYHRVSITGRARSLRNDVMAFCDTALFQSQGGT